jgi:hypothetical protein
MPSVSRLGAQQTRDVLRLPALLKAGPEQQRGGPTRLARRQIAGRMLGAELK